MQNNCKMDSEDDVMDLIAFLIKDHLPKDAVTNLHLEVGKIKAVKNIVDFKLFLLIEFNNKIDADAAKVEKFEYALNGQSEKVAYANSGALALYLAESIQPGRGSGY